MNFQQYCHCRHFPGERCPLAIKSGHHVRLVVLFWLLVALFLPACGSSGGDPSGSGSNPVNPGSPGNPGGPGGKGGTTLPYESKFTVTNHAAKDRAQVAKVSIPFQEGVVTSLDGYSVKGYSTCWRVLQQWPDGSVRVAQAQFAVELAANESRAFEVVSGSSAWQESFTRNPWVSSLWGSFSFTTEVKDIDGVPYYANLCSGQGQVLTETALTRTTRYRSFHVNPNPNAGIQRDFLSLTAYVTEYRTTPVIEVDVVLGNDYLGADDPGVSTDPNLFPLGDVAVGAFNAVLGSNPVAIAYADKCKVGNPVSLGGGLVSYPLLHDGNKPAPTTDHFLADGQTRKWRFNVLFLHPQGSPAEKQAVMNTLAAMGDEPLFGLATRKTWQGSRAFGLGGSFVDGPANVVQRAYSEYLSWASKDHFGPFGSWGDTKFSGTTGTPRNGPVYPVTLHAVQAEEDRLLRMLEGLAWQQACRPYHLWGLKIEMNSDILLWTGLPYTIKGGWPPSNENLGRKKIYDTNKYAHYRTGVSYPFNGPYGWSAYDNEHFSSDILFDYYTFTGDSWARDELAHLGECAMGLLRPDNYAIKWMAAARCEGWMLVSAVQVYLVTGESRVKTHFLDRIRRIIDRDRQKGHASKALCFQSNYAGTNYPMPHKFYQPYQAGPVIYGMLAAAKYFQDSTAVTIAEEMMTAIEYGWVKNYQDPKYGLVANGLRYYVPVEYNGNSVPANYFDTWANIGVRWGDSPLGGAHTFLIAALFQLSDYTSDRDLSDKAAEYGGYLLKAQMYNEDWRWNKWAAAIPPYHVP